MLHALYLRKPRAMHIKYQHARTYMYTICWEDIWRVCGSLSAEAAAEVSFSSSSVFELLPPGIPAVSCYFKRCVTSAFHHVISAIFLLAASLLYLIPSFHNFLQQPITA